FNQY
ncbi:hypothetical protein D041_3949B, partial [Vibrio parahaemolyticus EKP-008]